jgi:hypothetical protein
MKVKGSTFHLRGTFNDGGRVKHNDPGKRRRAEMPGYSVVDFHALMHAVLI